MPSSSTGVQFLVLALSGDDSEHRWKGSCAVASPLSQLAQKWASFHQVPENSVGFESKGLELDLQKTAADYSFDPSEQVELLCFPKMEEFMETEPVKAEPVVEPGRKGTRADAAKPSRMEEGSKKRKAEKAEASFAEVKPEKAEPKAEPKKKVKSGAAAFKAKPPKNGGPAQPDFDDPIEFVQTNPKKVGGTAFHRYEKYKAAKTVKEALSLGAAKGDVLYDWAKGFIKRL